MRNSRFRRADGGRVARRRIQTERKERSRGIIENKREHFSSRFQGYEVFENTGVDLLTGDLTDTTGVTRQAKLTARRHSVGEKRARNEERSHYVFWNEQSFRTRNQPSALKLAAPRMADGLKLTARRPLAGENRLETRNEANMSFRMSNTLELGISPRL